MNCEKQIIVNKEDYDNLKKRCEELEIKNVNTYYISVSYPMSQTDSKTLNVELIQHNGTLRIDDKTKWDIKKLLVDISKRAFEKGFLKGQHFVTEPLQIQLKYSLKELLITELFLRFKNMSFLDLFKFYRSVKKQEDFKKDFLSNISINRDSFIKWLEYNYFHQTSNTKPNEWIYPDAFNSPIVEVYDNDVIYTYTERILNSGSYSPDYIKRQKSYTFSDFILHFQMRQINK